MDSTVFANGQKTIQETSIFRVYGVEFIRRQKHDVISVKNTKTKRKNRRKKCLIGLKDYMEMVK